MFRIATFLYSILYTITLLVYGPIRLWKAASRNQEIEISERLGRRLPLPPGHSHRPTVWIHAVSVGEVNAARSLINILAEDGLQLYLSTTTRTGRDHAKNLFGGKARIFYFPLDWKVACRKFLLHIKPDVVLLVETEIWPNFLVSAKELDIPVVLVNGRISDQSFRNYVRFGFIVRPLLNCFSYFCMQSEQDLERIRKMGAPPRRTLCTGNLKFDYSPHTTPKQEGLKRSITKVFKPLPENLLLVCGSTKPGEEEILLSIFEDLRVEFPSLRLLIAPRHPHRGDQLTALVREREIDCIQRSKDAIDMEPSITPGVLILDSIGELASIYELADLVFIGGSLVPTGGQNLIEAAAYGKAILFGPHMENFRKIAESFIEAGAALQAQDRAALEAKVRTLLRSPETRETLGEKARAVADKNRGAVERTMEVIKTYLPEKKTIT